MIIEELEKLLKQSQELPLGYISKKRIHGKIYYYLQYYQGGSFKSVYISKEMIPSTEAQLAKRREIEERMKTLQFSGSLLAVLNENRISLTGSLMSGDKEVARFNYGSLTYIDDNLAPLYIKRTRDINSFLAKRVLDESRTNSRLIKKVMSIHDEDRTRIALKVHGLTITDNYWFRPKGSKLKYKDLIFTDIYSNVALKGEIIFYNKIPRLSPELTLTGSYEKCWKYIDNSWWLYKKENELELFSELFASNLANKLHIDTVKYYYDNGYIKCQNFASIYNFEPIYSLVADDDNYNQVFNILKNLDRDIALEYLKLMWFDLLINNVDRHNENYGLLRDKKDGHIVSLAPNFDNNLCLLSVDPHLLSGNGFILLFKKFLSSNQEALNLFKEIKLPHLDEQIIKDILKEIPIKTNEDALIKYLISRYQTLTHLV